MTRSKITALALTSLSALTLWIAPAFAQTYNDRPHDDETIIVTAPRVHGEVTGRSGTTGASVVTLSEQRIIDASDLDLRYSSDARELRRRINDTVADACRQVERRIEAPVDPPRDCICDATRDAMAQANELIAYARD
jgi:UrcA family protein